MSALVAHASLDPLPLEVTFSIICSDARGFRMTRRAGLNGTFPWTLAGPWVLRVGLPPWSGRPRARERKVRRNDRSVSGPPSLSLTLMDCGGAGSVALARDTWEEFVGVRWGRRVSVRAP